MPAGRADNFKEFVWQYIKNQWLNFRRALTYYQGKEELLRNAILYFYEKDTTTPKVTYEDTEMKSPQCHPVIADSAGDFPKIFIDHEEGYSVKLQDMRGTTLIVYSVDPEPDEWLNYLVY